MSSQSKSTHSNNKQDHHVILFKKYKVEMVIGEGSYAKVKLATNIINGQKVALKVIPKTKLQTVSHVKRLKREIRFLKLIQHPHIVKLYEVGELVDEIILVLEYVEGGELFDYIIAKKRFKEKLARKYFRQIVSALSYLHNSCLIHRDLKPENLLIDSHGNLKLADFGFVNFFDYENKLNTFCGSPMYVAPEMVGSRKYVGPEVDIWSLGVCLYVFFVGALPFAAKDPAETQRKILHAEYGDSNYIPLEAKSLIKGMLELDPKKRLTIEEIRHHPWTMSEYNSPPPNYLQDRPPLVTLDKEILERTARMGFNLNDLPKRILNDVRSPEFSLYYMVKELVERNKESKRRHEKNKEIQEAKQREKESSTNNRKSANSTNSAKNSARNSARERTSSSKNSTKEKPSSSSDKTNTEREKTNSRNSNKNSRPNSVREKVSSEKDKTHSVRASPDKDKTHSVRTSPDKDKTHSVRASPDKDKTHSVRTSPDKDKTHSIRASPEKDRTHSAKEKTTSVGLSERKTPKEKSHIHGNSNQESPNIPSTSNTVKLNKKPNNDRDLRSAESDNYRPYSQNDTLNNEDVATNSDETLNENKKIKDSQQLTNENSVRTEDMYNSTNNIRTKDQHYSIETPDNGNDGKYLKQKNKERTNSNDVSEVDNENDDTSKEKEIINSNENNIIRNQYIKEKKPERTEVSTADSNKPRRPSLVLRSSRVNKSGSPEKSIHPTSRSQTPNYYSAKNSSPNNDEVYSPHMNLNDSSQYAANPSTSISLVPISNNVSVVSSSKPAIQKSTIKRWGGTASENLHQQSQTHSRTSTPSNADNLYQSPPSSASHRAYMMSNHNNHIQGVIPPLSNVPISSDIPQPVPLSAIDKKLNENHLVNNNAKIKAYVINSAYSNAIVTPSGMNSLKEKLSAMAYMNDDNPEQDNPLNVMPNGRRKSNTSVPSSAKSQAHQSSQSIDHKNFSLSKKKIIEKLNE